MVSATDIITYIGVPLAVLGVMPIFYTLATSLYTRSKMRHTLHRNCIDAHVRTKLMTGAVDVDLPRYELKPLSRKCEEYWLNPKQKTISDASWSCFQWSQHEICRFPTRLQRSDLIRLPEAKIEFRALIMFLQDRGASLCLEGFRTLHEHRQHTPELTTLMEFVLRGKEVLSSTASKDSYPLLAFARPGKAHGSISLTLNGIIGAEHHLDLRRSRALKTPETYPPSWITVPLGTEQESSQFVISIGTSGIRHYVSRAAHHLTVITTWSRLISKCYNAETMRCGALGLQAQLSPCSVRKTNNILIFGQTRN